jgi:hypothetical protein
VYRSIIDGGHSISKMLVHEIEVLRVIS